MRERAVTLLLGDAPALRRDQLATYLTAMRARGDRARLRIGPPRIGLEFDALFTPEGAQDVLSRAADAYRKEAPAYTELAHIVGAGLVTSEGERWRRQRRIIQPLFTRARVRTVGPDIDAEARTLATRMAAAAAAAREIDLGRESARYGLRVLGRAVFGQDLDGVVDLLHRVLPILNTFAASRSLAVLPVPRALPTPSNRTARRAQEELEDAVDGLIRRRRQVDHADTSAGLLDLLLSARDPETGERLSEAEVRDQVLTFLLVGHETTASALALTLDLLGRHPAIQADVRAEALAAAEDGQGWAAAPPDALALTTRVVREALRLYPAAHTLVRRARPGAPILGEETKPGRIVAVSIWGIHRNPAVWPDPDTFDPDRFLPGRFDEHGDGRYAHLPFGGGPRRCIGVHLAMAELVTAVAAVVTTVRLRAPQAHPRLVAGLTLAPAGPLPCHPIGPG